MKVMARKFKLSLCVKLMPDMCLSQRHCCVKLAEGNFSFVYMIAESLEAGETG